MVGESKDIGHEAKWDSDYSNWAPVKSTPHKDDFFYLLREEHKNTRRKKQSRGDPCDYVSFREAQSAIF